MGSDIDNTVNIQTQVTNDYLQRVQESCAAQCKSEASGNTIIISGNAGDVNITAECTADASCSMSNSASIAAQSTIQNLIDQEIKAITDFMGDLSFTSEQNEINAYDAIVNNITQITSQTCNATSSSTVDNNFVYVSGTGSTGDINLLATSNAGASCAISNMSKIDSYNNVQNKTSQSSKYTGMFALALMVIIVIAIIAGVIFVVLFATTGTTVAASAVGGKSKDSSSEEELLAAAEAM